MLSYEDRLKLMRETKVKHTIEKRNQNGYTDLDDFGTVPISENYEVEPWYNSSNGSFYGYDGMAENFCRVMDAHDAYVDPMEMLCGRWRDMLVNYRGDVHYLPDWLKKKPKIMELMASATDQWSKRWDEQRFPYDDLKPLQEKYNIQTGIDSDAHLACDYRIGFELGFGGILGKIEKYRKINPEKSDFYDAEEKTIHAIIRFIDRHIEKIKELLKTEDRPEIKGNLEDMLTACKNIRLNSPETFHEVCQWTAFFNCASRVCTRDGAGFQMDTILYPYYERDVKAGILDDEKAKFLIANLLLIDPHYIANQRANVKSLNISRNVAIVDYGNETPIFNETCVSLIGANGEKLSKNNVTAAVKTIEIDFKSVLDETTVSRNTVYIEKDGTKLDVEPIHCDGIITFNVNGLLPSSSYRVYVSGNVKNVSGTPVRSAGEYSFITKAGGCSAEITSIKTGGTEINAVDDLSQDDELDVEVKFINTFTESRDLYVVYTAYVMTGDPLSTTAFRFNRNHLWNNNDWIQNLPSYIGLKEGYYEKNGAVTYNGHPFIAWVDPSNAKEANNGAGGYSYYPQDWGFSTLTFKLQVPTGRKIQGLTIDYDGNLSITESAGKRSATSITTYVGESATELGVAKRFMSYTDGNGEVVQNLGKDLDAFTIAGNGKDEIWVSLMIAGGDSVLATDGSGAYVRADNYIDNIQITAHLESNKVAQGAEITDSNYAAKSLYALDLGNLQDGKTAKSDDMSPGILASADNYSNAEVLGATSGLQFDICAVGSAGYGDAEWIPVLTAPNGTKNITYKITSVNPNGFDELDISYLAGVNSANGSSYVAIQGSDEAPIGDFGDSDYYNTFGDIRKIVDTTPGVTNTAPNVSKDYHDYGETLVLTDEVKGKKEYYVNFSINTENYKTAWLADIAFTEKIKTDFSDTDRYSTVTLTEMDYTGESANRGWIGYSWQTAETKPTGIDAIAKTTDNCVVVNAERWLQFNGDGTTNWLGFPDKNSDGSDMWTSGSFVLKLAAPEGKIFKGLNVELKGKNTIDACVGANMGTSITASVSDEFVAYSAPGNGYSYKTGMGAVKRFYSNTDENGIVKNNVGELTPFKVIGNNKSEMYLKITIGGGKAAWNHLTGMKIDGIFADKSVVDDIIFSGGEAFPTNGTLSAVYKLGSPETGEAMPEELTFILAVYKKVNGVNKVIAVNADTINNPTENTDYTVELTGLPKDDNSCCAKAFVWSNISGNMIPISNVYKLATE